MACIRETFTCVKYVGLEPFKIWVASSILPRARMLFRVCLWFSGYRAIAVDQSLKSSSQNICHYTGYLSIDFLYFCLSVFQLETDHNHVRHNP